MKRICLLKDSPFCGDAVQAYFYIKQRSLWMLVKFPLTEIFKSDKMEKKNNENLEQNSLKRGSFFMAFCLDPRMIGLSQRWSTGLP